MLILLLNQPAAGGGIAAELSQTLENAAISAAATNAIAAQASVTLGDVTLAATITNAIEASTSITLADVTLSAAAGNAIAADAANTLDDAALSGAATNAIAADASITLDAATLAATFSKDGDPISASLNVTLDDINLTATADGLATETPPATASGGIGMRPFRSRPIRLRETRPDIYAHLNATLGGVTLVAEAVMSEPPQYQRRRKAAYMLLMH